jgi:hypothetical protein
MIKVLLLNDEYIKNWRVRAIFQKKETPYNRVGEIIEFIENNPECKDDSFRIVEVDETIPWAIVKYCDTETPRKEYIRRATDYRFSVYDENLNYSMFSANCVWAKEWDENKGIINGMSFVHPNMITLLLQKEESMQVD